jgi:hypothetical protein
MAVLCQSCFQDIPAASLRCPRCGAPLPRPETEAEAGGTPWQRRSATGRIAAFAETLECSLLEPAAFFRTVRPGGGGEALSFAAAVNTMTAVIAWLWRSALAGPPVEGAGILPAAALILVFVPVLTVVAAAAWSSVLHVSLVLTGGARRSFSCTLQAVAYAASANSFMVFPLVGSIISAPWGIVLQVIGLREGHGISTGRALLAWLLPFLFFLLACGAILLVALGAVLELLPEIENYLMAQGAGIF